MKISIFKDQNKEQDLLKIDGDKMEIKNYEYVLILIFCKNINVMQVRML